MGADQTPDPTQWSDDQLDNLLDALADRAAERDDLDLPTTGVSRRTVLATLLGAGGLGVGATQLGAAASWGSASGTVGTQSSPIDQANVRDLDAKVLETEQTSTDTLSDAGSGTVTLASNIRLSDNQIVASAPNKATAVIFRDQSTGRLVFNEAGPRAKIDLVSGDLLLAGEVKTNQTF